MIGFACTYNFYTFMQIFTYKGKNMQENIQNIYYYITKYNFFFLIV